MEKKKSGLKQAAQKAQNTVVRAIDVNGNGMIDIEDVIIIGLRAPGIRIDRTNFLRRELKHKVSAEILEDAVTYTPLTAGVPDEVIDRIAREVIRYECTCVSGISAALSMPGGFTVVAALPADMIQYYGYMLRAAQKLMYLYGFPAIEAEKKENLLDTETINILILCMGVMYGVAGATNALKKLAQMLAEGVEKKLVRASLTKGAIYPIVKQVAKWFGIKINKGIFAGAVRKAIPVVGGIAGGVITFASFRPCCLRLKRALQNTLLSNPNCSKMSEPIIVEGDVEAAEE